MRAARILAALAGASIAAVPPPAAPLATLAAQTRIDAARFTLGNGLRVVVHTDRRTPVVAVAVAYRVGSADEPAGATGLAHLFEHLMFNGSQNAPGDYFARLRGLGALDQNADTDVDATTFFETVPVGALERTLFLEADRMGHLAPAITPALLEKQRGIVENEKRQRQASPYALLPQHLAAGLLGPDNPYAHAPLGSFADLDRVTVASARAWLDRHYRPGNAVLVLAGDIDAATARHLAERYFGALPGGGAPPTEPPLPPPPPPGVATVREALPAPAVSRAWAIPPLGGANGAALDVAAAVLNDPDGAFVATLTRQDRLATAVAVSTSRYRRQGVFAITADAAPGVDPARLHARLDALLAAFLQAGPDAAAIDRVARRETAWTLQSLESVAAKARLLANGTILAGDPEAYRARLAVMATTTPDQVRAAAARWLGAPGFALTVEPGTRAEEPPPAPARAVAATPSEAPAAAMPPVAPTAAARFPAVVATRLRGDIPLFYLHRARPASSSVAITLDAGVAAGGGVTQPLLLAMLRDGGGAWSPPAFAALRDRLAMQLTTGIGADRSEIRLWVPSANLPAAAAAIGALLRRPVGEAAALARVAAQRRAALAQTRATAEGCADRLLPALLYGDGSPYAPTEADRGVGAIDQVTPAAIAAFARAWLRPDKAALFVVSDRPLATVRRAFDAAFAGWTVQGQAGVKPVPHPAAPPPPSIRLLDRPGSDQSLIVGVQPTPLAAREDLLAVHLAAQALSGAFDSRLNTELRERRHWSYGSGGGFAATLGSVPYSVRATVQADHTAEALAAMRDGIAAFAAAAPITEVEFDAQRGAGVAGLAGRYEASDALLSAMEGNVLVGRAADADRTLPARYASLTLADARAAAARALSGGAPAWLVVGDAARIGPSLARLGLSVTSARCP